MSVFDVTPVGVSGPRSSTVGDSAAGYRAQVLHEQEAILSAIRPFRIHIRNDDNMLLAYKISTRHPERYIIDHRKGMVLKTSEVVVSIMLKPPLVPDRSGAEGNGGAEMEGATANSNNGAVEGGESNPGEKGGPRPVSFRVERPVPPPSPTKRYSSPVSYRATAQAGSGGVGMARFGVPVAAKQNQPGEGEGGSGSVADEASQTGPEGSPATGANTGTTTSVATGLGTRGSSITGSRKSLSTARSAMLPYYIPPANVSPEDVFQVELRAVLAESLRHDPALSPSKATDASTFSPLSPNSNRASLEIRENRLAQRKKEIQLLNSLNAEFDKLWPHAISLPTHVVPCQITFHTTVEYLNHSIELAANKVNQLQLEQASYKKQGERLQQRLKEVEKTNKAFEQEVEQLELEYARISGAIPSARVPIWIAFLAILCSILLPLL